MHVRTICDFYARSQFVTSMWQGRFRPLPCPEEDMAASHTELMTYTNEMLQDGQQSLTEMYSKFKAKVDKYDPKELMALMLFTRQRETKHWPHKVERGRCGLGKDHCVGSGYGTIGCRTCWVRCCTLKCLAKHQVTNLVRKALPANHVTICCATLIPFVRYLLPGRPDVALAHQPRGCQHHDRVRPMDRGGG